MVAVDWRRVIHADWRMSADRDEEGGLQNREPRSFCMLIAANTLTMLPHGFYVCATVYLCVFVSLCVCACVFVCLCIFSVCSSFSFCIAAYSFQLVMFVCSTPLSLHSTDKQIHSVCLQSTLYLLSVSHIDGTAKSAQF